VAGFSVCAFCHGQGRVAFESGPPTEPCGECGGVGVVYQGPTLQGAFAALVADDAAFATAAQGARERFVIRALAALEDRVAALEETVRRLR
jgi:DnaJ-class molecular chaperone